MSNFTNKYGVICTAHSHGGGRGSLGSKLQDILETSVFCPHIGSEVSIQVQSSVDHITTMTTISSYNNNSSKQQRQQTQQHGNLIPVTKVIFQ